MRLEPRTRVPFALVIFAPFAAIVASLVLCAGLVVWSGASIFEAYGLLLKGALGSGFALSETFARATPLIFTGLAAAVAFKSRFWNIGAEGQFIMGAVIGGATGLALYPMDSFIVFPLMILMGSIGGLLWGLIPAYLKIKSNIY